MAKQVIIYNIINDQAIQQSLDANGISYAQAAHHRENTIIDIQTRTPHMGSVSAIQKNISHDVAIVLMRNFINPGDIRVGTQKGMKKHSVDSLIEILTKHL